MEVLICEDELAHQQRLENILNELKVRDHGDIEIVCITDQPNDIIDYIQKNRKSKKIYFLDVDLKGNMNGIELAKEIRKVDPIGEIIFITSHLEYSLITFKYKVSALDYIIKQEKEKVKKRINDCLKEIKKREKILATEEKTLSINLGGEITKVNTDDILFIETSGMRKLMIHTLCEHLEFYGTLKELEKELDDKFYKVHRSYIVNKHKIKRVDKVNRIIYMINNEQCLVSARYLRGVIKNC